MNENTLNTNTVNESTLNTNTVNESTLDTNTVNKTTVNRNILNKILLIQILFCSAHPLQQSLRGHSLITNHTAHAV